MSNDNRLVIEGLLGYCGHRKVFCGFASAGDLVRASYADVLDDHGRGYQRRMSREHSLAFKRYIQQSGTTSLPLTFNLREAPEGRWEVTAAGELGPAKLRLNLAQGPVMTQVDGQHRLGYLQASPIPFAFMAYIGLTEAEEREVFAVINGKAKGLSGSLLDFAQAQSLGADLGAVSPALFIALGLNTDARSPWCGRLDLGGQRTVGNKRATTLRTMNQAAARMVKEAAPKGEVGAEQLLEHAISFWRAVTVVLPDAWTDTRHHLLTKGIGVYSLMSLAGILVREAEGTLSTDDFVARLSDFADQVDWSGQGPLQGFGGGHGADMALKMILQVRKDARARVAEHA